MNNEIKVPVLYIDKYDCCGCSACKMVCSNEAIKMLYDNEGFLYPKVNNNKCVGCNSCIAICPIKKLKKGDC
ncbi:formate hydrogenlyase subunit 6/NADH:ubiquinone oxidoreductase subunit I [Clostridium tetanomorphum]|uniref:4Fe-4S dicluster-binding protein n=1 Tax=Clostridium tetanomorphum TaxID=1553 RepID=UPI000446E0DD|nr:4Fe-4S dicluster-binding protein [Clostridium tetanomorphum]KAJ49019.1 coenzyme F420 hydrogenase/dehydrogenase subunit beta domain-containing protein [Clostridium tetanomorphum DSM 665]KAJ52112.1 coenzyme F420 hydrogenase/dehydrogenase subunit beta domain-containing protein [Clostridium tetanomorphum DSM 665]MBP1863034.1 formate hydrogenlyase subunit 6/NADH:ubiquinone oxidoreductase subunit I [Clostridium tetanomorphum]NRS82863.1 formate hydrogenlyase subunit 6/NADH:ubiquinone oxidoreductase